MIRRFSSLVGVTAVLLAAGGCTLQKQDATPLAGPSELGLSVSLSASPDTLTRDGVSQSQIGIVVRDASNQPVRSKALRLDMRVDGVDLDFGRLSSRNVVSDNNGNATAVYTSPQPPPVSSADERKTVTIVVTPLDTDARTPIAVGRTVDIRLVPPGIIVAPSDLAPSFEYAPTSAKVLDTVIFDASASKGSSIASYVWDFGDGTTGSGKTVSHAFQQFGTYNVVLTITDTAGRAASTSQAVGIGLGSAPVASFTFSPVTPAPGQSVFFNGLASRADPGRTIVSYRWDFGDGGSGGGGTASHVYGHAGTYSVTLVVADDAGQQTAVSQSVLVSSTAPKADFAVSPTAPSAGTQVNFNGALSTSGLSIVSYTWDFGDGAGLADRDVPTASHTYSTPGTYTVTLTIKDQSGAKNSVSKTVTVS